MRDDDGLSGDGVLSTLFIQASLDGIRIDPGFVLATAGPVLSALSLALAAMWRQAVAESKRKDQLIDRLLDQVNRTADVQDRTVSLQERERGIRR